MMNENFTLYPNRINVAFAYISVNLINFQRHYGDKDGVTEEGFDILHKIYCA